MKKNIDVGENSNGLQTGLSNLVPKGPQGPQVFPSGPKGAPLGSLYIPALFPFGVLQY